MKKIILMSVAFVCLSVGQASAHCEIPCGVFSDGARFDMIAEHAQTIEKSMVAINEISGAKNVDYHTISRWTTNKEKHANLIQDIASEYFLAQRVKIPAGDASDAVRIEYAKHLAFLHALIVKAMKTKQVTDVSAVDDLRDVADGYKELYFKDHGHEH